MSPSNGVSGTPITIQRVSEETTTNPQGVRATQVRIDFLVNGHGPFTERFDKASFDPVTANAALAQFAQKLGALGG